MTILHSAQLTEVFPKISSFGELRLGSLPAMFDLRFKRALKGERILVTAFGDLKVRCERVEKGR